MLMLWSARVSELRLSERKEFDLGEGVWTVPQEHSKMNNIIRRPIFEQIKPQLNKAMETYDQILCPGADTREPITISAANRYILRIRKGLDLGYWRAHDFRRTLVTRLSEEGVAPHVTERMLGHGLGGVMGVYNKHDWIEDQRRAYELHADSFSGTSGRGLINTASQDSCFHGTEQISFRVSTHQLRKIVTPTVLPHGGAGGGLQFLHHLFFFDKFYFCNE